MGAYKGHFRISCAVCERVIQPGKEGSETIAGVCDDCGTLSHIEAKRARAGRSEKNGDEKATKDYSLA